MFPFLRTLLVAAVVCCWLSPAVQAAPAIQIEALEAWSNVFGGRDVEFHFSIKATELFQGPVVWAVRHEKATIAGRAVEIVAAPNKPGRLTISFSAPMRKGVLRGDRLTIQVPGKDGKELARLEKDLWIFPEDPFADRTAWLKDRKITLYDPAKTTAAVFKKAGIPFDEENNQAAIAELREGMLIVGEGASFKDEPQVPELMIKLAARGVPVLCLAPAEGAFPVPAGKADEKSPMSLSFQRRQVITSLDKRLDATAWPPDGSVVVNSLLLNAVDGNVIGEVVRGDEGWSWLEMEFAAKRGRLIICGFGIVKSWDKGPTPRYLLAALLERLTERDKTERDDPKGADK